MVRKHIITRKWGSQKQNQDYLNHFAEEDHASVWSARSRAHEFTTMGGALIALTHIEEEAKTWPDTPPDRFAFDIITIAY